MVQLTGHNLYYSYTPERTILKDISFRFRSGEIVSILTGLIGAPIYAWLLWKQKARVM